MHLLDRSTRAIAERQDLLSIQQSVLGSLENGFAVDFACVCTYDAVDRCLDVSCVGAASQRIAAALAAFGRSTIERSVAYGAGGDAFGLADPEAVIVLFTEDQARPPLDFTVGAVDGPSRYVQMPDHTEIVMVADDRITSLIVLAARLAP
jgi:hypothetical protein